MKPAEVSRTEAVGLLLDYLAALYPTLQPTPLMARAWERAIESASPARFPSLAELEAAANKVARVHRHGAPPCALLIHALYGEWSVESRPRRDVFGAMIPGPAEHVRVLRDIETRAPLATYDERARLIEYETGRILVERPTSPAGLPPAMGALQESEVDS